MMRRLLDGRTMVDLAVERLREFSAAALAKHPEGYYLAFSGGKDSICIKRLAEMAGVPFRAYYNVTTIDPPDLMYFIRAHHPDVMWNRPEVPFLRRMVNMGFPRRQARWCCEEYKERGGHGRVIVTGIRSAESARRKGRRMFEPCYSDGTKLYLHPIIDWSDGDVWNFIHEQQMPYCSLYDAGWSRIGCLFCPMSRWDRHKVEMERYPRFTEAFRWAFRKLYARRQADGNPSVDRWANGDEMFDWWIRGKGSPHEEEVLPLFS